MPIHSTSLIESHENILHSLVKQIVIEKNKGKKDTERRYAI